MTPGDPAMAPDPALAAPLSPPPRDASGEVPILLEPVSHPELGPIPIADELFAVGRTEAPFASYPAAVVDALSRRHARIFAERGRIYVADLGSKNGTTVNGVPVRERPCRLRDGDEVAFGGGLSYRVRLGPQAPRPAAARVVGVILAPERDDLGLLPIVISRFPFLVGKGDETFARYKDRYPHQVNYLSRRHAHIFLKGGIPYVEDLGSTNGTFVSGRRLEEHAAPLAEGALLAFGGHHFVYRVGFQKEPVLDPTVTRVAAGAGEGAPGPEKTTFVAAADSFLDIFCGEPGPRAPPAREEEEPPPERAPLPRRSRSVQFLAQLRTAFAGDLVSSGRRYLPWGAGVLGLAVLVLVGFHWRGAGERDVRQLVAQGRYAEGAAAAERYLAGHPERPEVQALATEALVKARLPGWLARIRARDFAGAAAILAAMEREASHNPDIQPLVRDLSWLGSLKAFHQGRGGGDAPIRLYGDEEAIKAILAPWDQDPAGHQRVLERLSSLVPEFRDFHAEALSHLRRIQSDDAVYLAASERLKTAVATELNRDRPLALEPLLQEYGGKYPRLGLDNVRADLGRYLDLEAALGARRLDRVAILLDSGPFATPPFQAKVQALAAAGRLPPAPVLQSCREVLRAWRDGRIGEALAGLRQLAPGPWGDAASRDLLRRRGIADGYADLQKARGGKDYDRRLAAFYGGLDPDADAWFIRAGAADLAAHRDGLARQAQESLNRAQARWAQYREGGAIGEEERAAAELSGKFRSQARLLGEARAALEQGLRLFALARVPAPASGQRLRGEIAGEAEQQRRSLLALQASLEPGLLQEKLALIGEGGGEQGPAP